MRAEAGGPVHLVVGIGLNIMLDEAARAAVAATGNVADDIQSQRQPAPDRNAIVAAFLGQLVPSLQDFPRRGLLPHLPRWSEYDALQGREVRIENLGVVTRGVARGIDAHGALLLETPGGVQSFISGEVSVRIES